MSNLADRIVKELKDKGILDDNSIGYNPKDYNVTKDEFDKYTHDIVYKTYSWKKIQKFKQKGTDFETYMIPCEHKGVKFWLKLMVGQGDSYQLLSNDYYNNNSKKNEKL